MNGHLQISIFLSLRVHITGSLIDKEMSWYKIWKLNLCMRI